MIRKTLLNPIPEINQKLYQNTSKDAYIKENMPSENHNKIQNHKTLTTQLMSADEKHEVQQDMTAYSALGHIEFEPLNVIQGEIVAN